MALGEGRLLWPIRPKQHYFEHLLLGGMKRFNVAVRLFVGAMTMVHDALPGPMTKLAESTRSTPARIWMRTTLED